MNSLRKNAFIFVRSKVLVSRKHFKVLDTCNVPKIHDMRITISYDNNS